MKVNGHHLETRMSSGHVAVGLVFAFQTLVGSLGNFCLLFHYVSLNFSELRVRPTDVIFRHLTIANSVVILSKGVTQTMAALGVTDFLSDLGCKLVFYLHRVGRGLSMGTTCLLSVCQMITISPWTSRWAQHKDRAAHNTEHYTVLIWILHLSVNYVILASMTSTLRSKNMTPKQDFGYCYATLKGGIVASLYRALLSVLDALSLGLMTWASGSMVSMLHRHKQQVQHLHRAHVNPRTAPETRATQSIVMMVSTFVTCYTLSSTCHLCIALSKNPSWWMVNLSALLAASFPTVSPFLLMSHCSRLCEPCCVCMRNTSASI
ncbi:vomeronasal type-1 receptor 4-like [Erinaceus europaeus]|uniref:Vomeronasal type-1 receptor n=1 Tax=Erinaceus europaeus TaxID=9365 RepID=A0A1S3AQP3_ERIEU|nr:vomeronasal type-1 receptor 4-like [Erinaceus europaeus]